MGQIKTALIPVKVDYTCDNCNEGHFRPKNITLMLDSKVRPHVCNNKKCLAEYYFSKDLPATVLLENMDDVIDLRVPNGKYDVTKIHFHPD